MNVKNQIQGMQNLQQLSYLSAFFETEKGMTCNRKSKFSVEFFFFLNNQTITCKRVFQHNYYVLIKGTPLFQLRNKK